MESQQVETSGEQSIGRSEARAGGGGPQTFRPRRRVVELDGAAGELSLAEALSRLRARRDPVLLDSAGGQPRTFSLFAFDPLTAPSPRSLRELRTLLARYVPRGGGDALPDAARVFSGGFVGALAYDLGVEGEELDLPAEPWRLPLIAGGLYCDYLLRDEAAGRTWMVLGEEPGDGRPPVDERRAQLLRALEVPAEASRPRPLAALIRHVPSAEHCRRIDEARRLIALGELYQANLAHAFERDMEGDPVDIYLLLRAASPTPYAGFLRADDPHGEARFALLSCSPELLLEVDPASPPSAARARTRPIKGTSKRPLDPVEHPGEDALAAQALLESAKDQAELAMIVDLERNDLGRVARRGGVSVGRFPQLESHVGVHHLVADVVATLRSEVKALDVVAALFPGGSITGAPKLRSMEAIAALEEEGRGFAFGSMGCVDARGSARLSILIRTLTWRPRASAAGQGQRGTVQLRVGGGITWGSDPADEDAETLAKAAALLGALDTCD